MSVFLAVWAASGYFSKILGKVFFFFRYFWKTLENVEKLHYISENFTDFFEHRWCHMRKTLNSSLLKPTTQKNNVTVCKFAQINFTFFMCFCMKSVRPDSICWLEGSKLIFPGLVFQHFQYPAVASILNSIKL